MRKAIIATAAITAMAGIGQTAFAQNAGIDEPRRIMNNFDSSNIGPVLTDLGVVWQERQTKEGQSFIAASVGTNFSFNLYPAACLGSDGATGCVGAHYVALYRGKTPNPQTVTAFNQAFPFTSAGVTPSGSAFISRYEIADYGIPRGNVASSLASFLYLAERFENELSSAGRTVQTNGMADDMSARFLNGQTMDDLGIERQDDYSIGAIHRAAFDETTHIVRILEDQESAPKNKIRNMTK